MLNAIAFAVLSAISPVQDKAQPDEQVRAMVAGSLRMIKSHESQIEWRKQIMGRVKAGKINPAFERPLIPPNNEPCIFGSEQQRQKAIKNLEEEIESHVAAIKKIESGEIVFGRLPDPLGVGNVGTLQTLAESPTNIFQVIDEKNMLVRIFYARVRMGVSNGRPVDVTQTVQVIIWLRGVSTKGVADGMGVKLTQVFRVTGTMKHEVQGTVLLVEPLDPKLLEQAAKAIREESVLRNREADERAKAEAAIAEQAKAAKDKADKEAAIAAEKMAPVIAKEKAEKDAAQRLGFAKVLLRDPDKKVAAINALSAIVQMFPDTKAGKEAAELLKKR